MQTYKPLSFNIIQKIIQLSDYDSGTTGLFILFAKHIKSFTYNSLQFQL